jgi:hypothetical protein
MCGRQSDEASLNARSEPLFPSAASTGHNPKGALESGPAEPSATCGPYMTTRLRKSVVEHGDQQHAFRRDATLLLRTARVAVDSEILPGRGWAFLGK